MISIIKIFMKRLIGKCCGNASDGAHETTKKEEASKPANKQPSNG